MSDEFQGFVGASFIFSNTQSSISQPLKPQTGNFNLISNQLPSGDKYNIDITNYTSKPQGFDNPHVLPPRQPQPSKVELPKGPNYELDLSSINGSSQPQNSKPPSQTESISFNPPLSTSSPLFFNNQSMRPPVQQFQYQRPPNQFQTNSIPHFNPLLNPSINSQFNSQINSSLNFQMQPTKIPSNNLPNQSQNPQQTPQIQQNQIQQNQYTSPNQSYPQPPQTQENSQNQKPQSTSNKPDSNRSFDWKRADTYENIFSEIAKPNFVPENPSIIPQSFSNQISAQQSDWSEFVSETETTFVDTSTTFFNSSPPQNSTFSQSNASTFLQSMNNFSQSATAKPILPPHSLQSVSTDPVPLPQPMPQFFLPVLPTFASETVTLTQTVPEEKPLTEVLKDLIEQERLDEACALEAHFQLENQFFQKESEYKLAVKEKKTGELLEIKNALESLKFKISSSPILKWCKSNPDEITISEMTKQLEDKTNEETTKEFKGKFSSEKLKTLSKESLEKARDEKKEAKKLFQFLLLNPRMKPAAPPSLPIIITLQPLHIKNWEQMLNQCQTELQMGLKYVDKVVNLTDKGIVINSPKFESYIKGIFEIYRIVKRINASADYFAPKLTSFSISLETIFYIEQINSTFRNISEKLNSLSFNHSFEFAPIKNWESSSNCCNLCRVPLLAFGENSFTWENQVYHSGCANFWYNRVSQTPPPSN